MTGMLICGDLVFAVGLLVTLHSIGRLAFDEVSRIAVAEAGLGLALIAVALWLAYAAGGA